MKPYQKLKYNEKDSCPINRYSTVLLKYFGTEKLPIVPCIGSVKLHIVPCIGTVKLLLSHVLQLVQHLNDGQMSE